MIKPRRRGITCGLLDGVVEGDADDMVDLTFQGYSKFFRRGANQVGLANARKKRRKRLDAAGLRFAARDPEDISETGQSLGGGVRIGGLGIVDEQDPILAADLLHAMRQ